MSDSLKSQAEDLIENLDKSLVEASTESPSAAKRVGEGANSVMEMIFNVVSDVDIEGARQRVAVQREKYPSDDTEKLVQRLIRDKCQSTGAIGAVTSGAGLVPGIGTATAVTLGVAADVGATFKLQAELVLEIAAVYDYPLTEEEKQQLVLFITGLSAGTTALARRAGQAITLKAGEKFAGKAALKAMPVVGMLASAGTNVLSTYVIGQRADAYFRLGPEAVGTWRDSLRTISGLDERRIGGWLAEKGSALGSGIGTGLSFVGQQGQKTGLLLAETAQSAAQGTQSGLKTGWQVGRAKVFGPLWRGLTFVPRRVFAWVKGKRGKKGGKDTVSG